MSSTPRARNFDPSLHLSVSDGTTWVGTVIIRGGRFHAFSVATSVGDELDRFPEIPAAPLQEKGRLVPEADQFNPVSFNPVMKGNDQ